MATVPGPNKTEFVREVLRSNPQANVKAVLEAWTAAGHEGAISDTLIQRVRSEMGLVGNMGRGRKRAGGARRKPGRTPRARAASGASTTDTATLASARSTAKAPDLADLEADFDRLLFGVMELGGMPEVEEAIRQARRLLVLRHGG